MLVTPASSSPAERVVGGEHDSRGVEVGHRDRRVSDEKRILMCVNEERTLCTDAVPVCHRY